MLVTNVKYGDLYDRIEHTISKVLKKYGENDIVSYTRYSYAFYYNEYRRANKKDIRKYKNWYYNDNGKRILFKKESE
jgi:ABC-type phosphate transport system substrate-binding protein